jgi:hypothetical protein
MRSTSTQSSPRSLSFTSSAALLDADGIKTTIATVAAAVTYTGAALNGAYANPGPAIPAPGGHAGVAQWPVATASSAAGSFVNGSSITWVGLYGGVSTTRTATVVGTDGNASFIADGPLESVTSVTIAAQVNTSGAWTLGFTDLAPRKVPGSTSEPVFRGIVGNAVGNVAVSYTGSAYSDVLVCIAGQQWPVDAMRIIQATTTIAFTALE